MVLTEQEVRELSVRRTRAVLPAMIFAILLVFLYLAGMGYFRDRLLPSRWTGLAGRRATSPRSP